MTPANRGLLADVLVGGLVGGVVGLIAAVNVVIFSGVESGYETSLSELFEYSTVAGLLTVVVFVAGPIVGVIVARRIRSRRESGTSA